MPASYPIPPGDPIKVGAPCAAIVSADVARALAEDIGSGDASAVLVDAATQGVATVIAREPMVLAGQAWFDACFASLDPACSIDWHYSVGAQGFENWYSQYGVADTRDIDNEYAVNSTDQLFFAHAARNRQ